MQLLDLRWFTNKHRHAGVFVLLTRDGSDVFPRAPE